MYFTSVLMIIYVQSDAIKVTCIYKIQIRKWFFDFIGPKGLFLQYLVRIIRKSV